MKNLRKSSRLDCPVPVEGSEKGVFSQAKLVDIGKGGIGVLSSSKVRPHKKIALELDLTENGEPAMILGEVQWSKKDTDSGRYRLGIKFVRIIEKGSQGRVRKYLGDER